MFTVDAGNPGVKQFSLPADVAGLVLVNVRDNHRVVGEVSADSVDIDHLVIRTESATSPPPGC
jgi:hypothetical protein